MLHNYLIMTILHLTITQKVLYFVVFPMYIYDLSSGSGVKAAQLLFDGNIFSYKNYHTNAS